MASSESKILSLHTVSNHMDVVIGSGIISILLVMIIPMPSRVLDMLLALNITLSLVTLLVAIYTQQPLEFSIFPSLTEEDLDNCVNNLLSK